MTKASTTTGTINPDEAAHFGALAADCVARAIARRAVACFPRLAEARLVRQWGALRVLSPDGLPIYQESERNPGAFLVTCHSGVTLAAAHALEVATALVAGEDAERFTTFSTARFAEGRA